MSKNTSITLGDHFEKFINAQLSSGRFNSTCEVSRAVLMLLENNESKLKVLRDHLAISEAQADQGDFIDYSINGLITEMDAEYESGK